MALKPPELMYCDSGGLFYMCVVYLNYVYYVKTAGWMYYSYGTLVLFTLSFIR